MTFKSRLRTFFFGKWTSNRLLSRKWWLVAGGLITAIGLDIAGRALGSDTLGYMRDVTVAYLAVQGALDWSGKRNKPKDPGGDI